MPQTRVLSATGDGVTVAFTLSSGVASENVYLGRLHEIAGTDYLIDNAVPRITFAVAPVLGETIEVWGDPLTSLSSSGVAASKSGFLTAGTIIKRAAVQLGVSGIGAASQSDPYASTDQNFVQLCELLNMVGEDLQNKAEWAHFIREASIVTVAGSTSAPLPADFYKMIDQSQWNRSTRFPVIGPLSGQETQYLRARLAGVMIQVPYRVMGNVLQFAIAATSGQTLTFEYVSSYWVWSAAGTQPDATSATANGDTVLYDDDLTIQALKVAFLEAKGFDATAANERYQDILEHAIYKNVGAKTLTVGGIGINSDHLIDATNLPVTGYG